ncbi:NUDIX hydrolase [Lyngbya confervoides BDU141951]|uniref:NUDIX hydrolase n=2 Tax=Lyngbya TaxID=28073 RepID=A0ABD4SZU6_9CYAN|nr:NUDIX hydrolase [Lyngbya confervoides BDU141951]
MRPRPHPQEILLIKHQSRTRPGKILWLPPGGGLEAEDESIFACAQREAKEESGLDVQVSRIAYVHEFIDATHHIRHVAFYMATDSFQGTISREYLPVDATDALAILDIVWVNRRQIADLSVYPTYLKTSEFWADAQEDFSSTKYLEIMRSF